jgi:hypothetical protein
MKKALLSLLSVLLLGSMPAVAQTYTTVSTFAGASTSGLVNGSLSASRFNGPYGVCSDSVGTIYVADAFNNCIRKISGGIVTTVAGNGAAGDVDAQGANARFNSPTGVYFKNGYLYICDNLNNKIKRMDAAGNVVTIAGSGAWSFGDGPALQAAFKEPKSIVVDDNNVVYIADYENHCVRKLENGQVTTHAGTGTLSGDALGAPGVARFHRPRDLAVDAAGNLFVVDLMNHKVKKIDPSGVTTLFAGSGAQGGTDGIGAAASFSIPVGIDWMLNGDLVVLDAVGARLRRITPGGLVTTFAGNGSSGYTDGPCATATFDLPQDICLDPSGNLYVGDRNNNVIRILTNTDTLNPKGIEEHSFAGLLTIFPNPSADQLTIAAEGLNGDHLSQVSIYDVNGKLVKTVSAPAVTGQYVIDIREFSPATYFITATGEKGKYTGTFIRE